jgi:DNA-binding NarL/FixJ family response regulator
VAGRPDLSLLAADLPGDGIAATRRIAGQLADTKLVVLTAWPSDDELIAAVLAGASGYLPKNVSPVRLPHALRAVLAGEAALPRRHTAQLLAALRGRQARRAAIEARAGGRLTDREWEVLNLLASGLRTAEIGARLGISEITVRRHISGLLTKLDLPDRASAVELVSRRSNG